PFEALRRLATVTRGLAVVESVCAVVPGMEHHALAEFLESDELNGDPTNWWAPNRRALMAFARAAGFGGVECPVAPPPAAAPVVPADEERPVRRHLEARVPDADEVADDEVEGLRRQLGPGAGLQVLGLRGEAHEHLTVAPPRGQGPQDVLGGLEDERGGAVAL